MTSLIASLVAAVVLSAFGLRAWAISKLDSTEPLSSYVTQCEGCGLLTEECVQNNCTETMHAICTRCEAAGYPYLPVTQ